MLLKSIPSNIEVCSICVICVLHTHDVTNPSRPFFRRLQLFSSRPQIRSSTSRIHRMSDSPEHNLGRPGHSQICEQVKRDLTIKYDCIGQGQSIHIITHASNERLGKPLLRQQAVVIYLFPPPTPVCLASAVCLLSLSFLSCVVLLLFVLFHGLT